MRAAILMTTVAIGLAVVWAPTGGEPAGADQTIRGIEQSHLDANVPASADFKRLLERDLAEHLSGLRGHPVRVTYQLLRDGPTQTGIAHPKYYAWIVIADGGKTEEGAVRLAVIDREQFHVTDYLSAAKIAARPTIVQDVFPRALCDDITQRASRALGL